ncbi:MAG: hypothetical protein ACLGI3_11335 [Actinomycetes bacterium]
MTTTNDHTTGSEDPGREDPEPEVTVLDGTPAGEADDDDLLLGNGAELFARWEQIQGRFVDEPRLAVEEADGLVGQVVDDLSRAFADQRERLEHQWKAGQDVSTEDLRRALQRYRAFFQRLVAV